MNPIASPRAPLALWLAIAAPTAGCVQITDFEDPTEEGSGEPPIGSTDGSGTTGVTSVGTSANASETTAGASDTAGATDTTAGATDTAAGASDTAAGETLAETTTESSGAGVGETEMGTTTGDIEPEPLPECPGVGLGAAALGEACAANEECASGLCTIYTDAPLNADAICAFPVPDCSMRITGTSLDLVTGQPLSGSELRVVTASAAVTDPVGAMAIVTDISGIDGRLDVVTPGEVNGSVGLVALLDAPGYHLTGTVLAAPLPATSDFGVANDAHDLWLVSSDALTEWSATLSLDPAIDGTTQLPLGFAGGAIGLVRDAAGVPVSGATVSPVNAGSQALVRYLNDDGTFGTAATGNLGVFVVINPGLAESFEAVLDGVSLGVAPTASEPEVVFTLTFTAP